jgi:hypothetical protein
MAAYNFLQKLLPYLTIVVFQDGVYWVAQFPQHPASMLLRHIMQPWYDRWAHESRTDLVGIEHNCPAQQIYALNDAAQTGFTAVTSSMLGMQQEQQLMQRNLSSARAADKEHKLIEGNGSSIAGTCAAVPTAQWINSGANRHQPR